MRDTYEWVDKAGRGHKVQGLVTGNLGIDCYPSGKSNKYRVTHIPTGKSLHGKTPFVRQEAAMAYCEELLGRFDLTGTDPEALAARNGCSLEQMAHAIEQILTKHQKGPLNEPKSTR